MSTRVKNEFSWRFGSKPLFSVKTVIFYQNRAHRVNTGQTMSTRVKTEFLGYFGSTSLFFGQNSIHWVDTHQMFFFFFCVSIKFSIIKIVKAKHKLLLWGSCFATDFFFFNVLTISFFSTFLLAKKIHFLFSSWWCFKI